MITTTAITKTTTPPSTTTTTTTTTIIIIVIIIIAMAMQKSDSNSNNHFSFRYKKQGFQNMDLKNGLRTNAESLLVRNSYNLLSKICQPSE